MAEDLSAVKHFSTFLIFTASFQISAFLKMNAICLKRLPSFPSTSANANAAAVTIMESRRGMQTESCQKRPAFRSARSPPEAEAQTLQYGKKDHCRRWLSHVTLKHTIPNAYDC